MCCRLGMRGVEGILPGCRRRPRLLYVSVLAFPIYVLVWLATTITFHDAVHGVETVGHEERQKRSVPVSKQEFIMERKSLSKAPKQVDEIQSKKDLFIHYQLYHGDRPYNLTFGPWTRCRLGVTFNKRGKKPIERVPLSKQFADILNVTTYIQTNMKIISIGDSVGMQFQEVLEEAAGGVWQDNLSGRRVVYHNAWGEHESVAITAPLRHTNGALAAFRMTGLLLQDGKGKSPPNAGPNMRTGAGGWMPDHVHELRTHPYFNRTTTLSVTPKSVQSFDAMLFRIPHGWLTLDVITKEKLTEALLLANELFGVHTVIIHTLFLNNNVKTKEELQQMHDTNHIIRELVEAWNHTDRIPTMLLLDFGGWIDKLVDLNARQLGMIDTKDYMLDRLGCLKYPPSVATACATLTNRTECTCIRNMISIDGMHWCMESLGGRITAAMACLLRCSLTPKNQHVQCAQRCNDEFMSLKPAIELSADVR